jgi:predicted  nucleic acid-binding Zn-ribbon protein
MTTRLSQKKVEDVIVALLTNKELAQHTDLIKTICKPIISATSTNQLLSNGSNVTYSKEEKARIMNQVKAYKPTDKKAKKVIFDRRPELKTQYKQAHNLKKLTADDEHAIIQTFIDASPENAAFYQTLENEYEKAVDEYYERIMTAVNDNGVSAFRGNALYEFSRKSCDMSATKPKKEEKNTIKIPLQPTQTRVKKSKAVDSEDESE